MKKVILVTFSASYNFGASLQAYSLQNTLKLLGADVSILDIRKEEHREVSYFSGIKGLLFNVLIWIKKEDITLGNIAFENFSNEYFRLTEENFSNYEYLQQNPPRADIYITGSDQVFNPECCNPTFFLNFCPSNCIRASYAASLGRTSIPAKNIATIREFLKKYQYISLREESGKNLVDELVKQKTSVNIDPVFLTPASEWRKIEKPVAGVQEKFVLCYCMYRPRNINKIVRKIKKLTGAQILILERSSHRLIFGDRLLLTCGPKEFLWLVDHAEMIYTTSFHGTAFSLIFGKKVKIEENPDAPGRITNLLNILGCSNLLNKTLDQVWSQNATDCKKAIQIENDKSVMYLGEVLGIHEISRYNI